MGNFLVFPPMRNLKTPPIPLSVDLENFLVFFLPVLEQEMIRNICFKSFETYIFSCRFRNIYLLKTWTYLWESINLSKMMVHLREISVWSTSFVGPYTYKCGLPLCYLLSRTTNPYLVTLPDSRRPRVCDWIRSQTNDYSGSLSFQKYSFDSLYCY